jgi:hypothetical protein
MVEMDMEDAAPMAVQKNAVAEESAGSIDSSSTDISSTNLQVV